jgi:erythromycin esterase-like protein
MRRDMPLVETPTVGERDLVEGIQRVAYPLEPGRLTDYDPLLDLIGDARIVLLGEASHGTHEFYRERALITRRLIEHKGFSHVAVEGDWPECYRVNQYVTGGPGTAHDALGVFAVYPTWMWGNLDVLHFIQWLRRYNDGVDEGMRKVGFNGLDLYSLFASMHHVISYLETVDPQAAEAARRRYACFEPFGQNKDLYAYGVGLGVMQSCEAEAVAMLQELRRKREELTQLGSEDAYFYALMAATVARDGERYYRAMYQGDVISWNLRDMHMMNTLDALLEHFHGSKAVVWEHNTHIGDFRATADANQMVNVGQLVRERHPGQSIAVGFGTYEGSVTASQRWGDVPEYMRVPPAAAGSYDSVMHRTKMQSLLLLLQPLREQNAADGLNEWRGQRAIGVVYHPEYERGNYVPTRLAERYDAYIHIDRSRAVKPLHIEPAQLLPGMAWDQETYPTGY